MPGYDGGNRPIAKRCVHRSRQVAAELFAFAERQIVKDIRTDKVFGVKITLAPLCPRIKNILVERRGISCLRRGSPGTKITDAIGHTFGISVRKLTFKAVGNAFLQDHLKGVIG